MEISRRIRENIGVNSRNYASSSFEYPLPSFFSRIELLDQQRAGRGEKGVVFFARRAILLSGEPAYYRFLKRRRHFFKKVVLFFPFLTDSPRVSFQFLRLALRRSKGKIFHSFIEYLSLDLGLFFPSRCIGFLGRSPNNWHAGSDISRWNFRLFDSNLFQSWMNFYVVGIKITAGTKDISNNEGNSFLDASYAARRCSLPTPSHAALPLGWRLLSYGWREERG